VPNFHTEFLAFGRYSPPFFFLVLPTSRLVLREISHMQAGQCDSQMGTKYWGGGVR
jgi:hypothetical protein